MITKLSTPHSSLKDSQARIQMMAHNTAKATSDGFSWQQVTNVEIPQSLVVGTSVDTLDLSPQDRAIAESLPWAQNNVNLVSETVNQIAAQQNILNRLPLSENTGLARRESARSHGLRNILANPRK